MTAEVHRLPAARIALELEVRRLSKAVDIVRAEVAERRLRGRHDEADELNGLVHFVSACLDDMRAELRERFPREIS